MIGSMTKISLAALILASQNVLAADDICHMRGSSLSCEVGVVDSISNTGSVKLKGTEVSGKAVVTGGFKAAEAKLSQLKVTGPTELLNSTVLGNVDITGNSKFQSSRFQQPVNITGNFTSENDSFNDAVSVTGKLEAEASQFNGPLVAAAREVSFSHVSAEGITIKSSGPSGSKQSLFLKENSEVKGPIVFESGNGMIFVAEGSQITGEVSGAQVYHAG